LENPKFSNPNNLDYLNIALMPTVIPPEKPGKARKSPENPYHQIKFPLIS
jgi:hypothetical protein